jgi:transposase
MQKALSLMNLQLHNVISDITGTTGMRIIRAILAGERDRDKLASLKDHRIKNSAEIIAKSLEGDYRVEHLFALRQAVELFDFYRQKIDECDQQILAYVQSFEAKVDLVKKPLAAPRRAKKNSVRNEPKQDLRPYLYQMSGVDLTRIPGINIITAQTILGEIGFDMSKWPTEKNFASWLALCPDNRKSGGKILSSKSKKVVNRAAQALRMAAFNLKTSQSALGAYYRRTHARLGAPKAITATAHKLARMVYRMLKYGEEYVDAGVQAYEEKYKARCVKNLQKRAASLGYELAPKQVA